MLLMKLLLYGIIEEYTMAVKFKPKPGKPHIKINEATENSPGIYLWPIVSFLDDNNNLIGAAKEYCMKVNPGEYSTPGEAARALHYGSKS